jgi:hypothetical protein
MANNNNDDQPTIERGTYGDRGVLERGRPDGLGSPSDDEPVLLPLFDVTKRNMDFFE